VEVRDFLTRHPLYFLRTYSRARSCAFSSWDEFLFGRIENHQGVSHVVAV
jgi:hypothetical protein